MIVVAAPDVPESVAVTTATPPASEIDLGATASVTSGVASSSTMVSVTFGGLSTLPPAAIVPETDRATSAESTLSGFAVIVTVPVLAVCPAATISSVFALTSKSSLLSGDNGFATPTVSVTAADAVLDRPAVTVATPPASAIEAEDSIRLARAAPSSSRITTNGASSGSLEISTPWLFDATPVTATILSPSPASLSFTAVTVTCPVLVLAPAAMTSFVPVSVKSLFFVSFPGDAEIVTVVAALDG